MMALAVLFFLLLESQVSLAKTPLEWRQEFNGIVASIDTLMRMEGDGDWSDLDRHRPELPEDISLVLLFWADDEAEIFINGYRVAQTRLTPVQVEIPKIYLREQNVIQAHCWDTDGIESGFMAGLYVRDGGGRLRPILVTDDGLWRTGENNMAEVRFYSNDKPDIPGAYVIWGDGLYGEVWLETEFSVEVVGQAVQRRPVQWSRPAVEPMQTHQVISRIVQLQKRQTELEQLLGGGTLLDKIPRYSGYVTNRLAFSLGRAGRLSERNNRIKSDALKDWVEQMSEAEQSLIFRPQRELKGVEAATAKKTLEGADGGEEGRRKRDYLPPPERGSAVVQGAEMAVLVPLVRIQQISSWWHWTALFGLLVYAAVLGRSWWQLYSDEVWKS
ncbi:MAG: hypothetical protein ACPHSD_11715 [Candidatus Latescibacterota bacterium]